jgi:hypothetical protein
LQLADGPLVCLQFFVQLPLLSLHHLVHRPVTIRPVHVSLLLITSLVLSCWCGVISYHLRWCHVIQVVVIINIVENFEIEMPGYLYRALSYRNKFN